MASKNEEKPTKLVPEVGKKYKRASDGATFEFAGKKKTERGQMLNLKPIKGSNRAINVSPANFPKNFALA